MMASDSIMLDHADQEESVTQPAGSTRASETLIHLLNSEEIDSRLRDGDDSTHTVCTRPAARVTFEQKAMQTKEAAQPSTRSHAIYPRQWPPRSDSTFTVLIATSVTDGGDYSTSHTTSSPSQLVLTSTTTISASAPGQTPSVQVMVTTVSTILAAAPTATSAQDGSTSTNTKIGLGVGIPVGIILVIILVIGGFIFGRRAAKSEKQDVSTGWCRFWKKTGEDKQDSETPERLCLSTSREKHELSGDQPPQELPTEYNVQELPEQQTMAELPEERTVAELPEERAVVEVPQKSPIDVTGRSAVDLPRESPAELE